MQHWTFANDHGQNPQMQLAQRYVAHWPEMREKNVGLLLWGGVGTGKSFMAGCIANALMEQEVAVCMTNFARIMNELNNAFSGRNEVVDRLCGYPLLVIDDFGMERGTEYALEQIYNIIDSRYRSRKPLIVTTNLTLTELKNPQDTAHARIYDRLLELCTPIACTGPSMRKDRCSAYVPEHHEAIVSPEIARAAHLVASSSKKCGVQDIVVIRQGALKGFVGIHPNWNGINAESIRSLCLSTYLPEEVAKLNKMAEMRSGKKLDMALLSDYLTVSGTCFINQSSPVMTISKNGIRFSKACHTRLDDCEYVELLYHPILQVVILRKSNHGFSTAMHWRDDNDVHSAFSARAFSGLILQTLNWKMNCRYQCRGICRGQGNAKFLIFELDESRILTGKNQYEQENCSMNLKCRLYRSKWVQSITVSDVMESGQVVENPMIGAIPSRNEVQRELDDLLMSM